MLKLCQKAEHEQGPQAKTSVGGHWTAIEGSGVKKPVNAGWEPLP